MLLLVYMANNPIISIEQNVVLALNSRKSRTGERKQLFTLCIFNLIASVVVVHKVSHTEPGDLGTNHGLVSETPWGWNW